jgi:hypothetical protein
MTMPKTPENIRMIEGFLRLPTLLQLSDVSVRQKAKLVEAIETPPPISLGVGLMLAASENLLTARPIRRSDVAHIRAFGEQTPALPMLLGVKTKGSPSYTVDHRGVIRIGRTLNRDDSQAASWLDYFQSDRVANKLWHDHPQFVARRLLDVEDYPVSSSSVLGESNPCGKLSALQEGSCKVRWIANPLLAFQALAEPLKVKLQEYSRIAYPEIEVDDQDRGRLTVVAWLQDHRTVWSFDCTSFTDRFPLILQTEVLHRLQDMGIADQADYDVFHAVCAKSWSSTDLGRDVRWSVGQPLGFGPSFPIATLTHAIILDGLDVKRSGLWRVVGDDVVIADPSLASRYKEYMHIIGVEINLTKSLISDNYAEFLGKLITPWGITPSMKVKFLLGHEQTVDNLKFYGKHALSHMTEEQLRYGQGVFLPPELGGEGWHLESISYVEWLKLVDNNDWARRKINKELMVFLGPDALNAHDAVEKIMTVRAKYYDENTLPIAPVEWGNKGDAVMTFNSFTNIPVSYASPAKPVERRLEMPTFVSTIDSRVAMKSDTLSIAGLVLNKYGFINESEKPFDGQSSHYRSHHDEREPSARSPNYRPIFRRGPLKRFLEREKGNTETAKAQEILKAFAVNPKGNTHGKV